MGGDGYKQWGLCPQTPALRGPLPRGLSPLSREGETPKCPSPLDELYRSQPCGLGSEDRVRLWVGYGLGMGWVGLGWRGWHFRRAGSANARDRRERRYMIMGFEAPADP